MFFIGQFEGHLWRDGRLNQRSKGPVALAPMAAITAEHHRAVGPLITRSHAHREGVPAAMTAAPTAQLSFQINEPHVVRSPAGQARVANHRPVSADGTGRLDEMPHPQVFYPES